MFCRTPFWLALSAVAAAAGAARGAAPELAPVPEPRPSEFRAATGGAAAPARAPLPPEPNAPSPPDAAAAGPPEPVRVEPPIGPTQNIESFNACVAELADLGVTFDRIAPIDDTRACAAPRPLRVTAVDAVEIRPAIKARCPVARALALWVDRVAAPLARLYLEDPLDAVVTGTDYQCRERRGDGSGKISEHAFANAVDVMGLAFASGKVMAISEPWELPGPERALQAGIRGGACAFFTTVLGPTSNAAHSDHFHLDMAERRGGYRLCE